MSVFVMDNETSSRNCRRKYFQRYENRHSLRRLSTKNYFVWISTMLFKLTFPILLLLLTHVVLASTWETFGPKILSGQEYPSSFGSVVKLSHDGKRMIIGSPTYLNGAGAVFLFEQRLENEKKFNDRQPVSWALIDSISGFPGEGLGDFISLSEDGLCIAIRRHYATTSIVQVYKISETFHQLGSDISCPSKGHWVALGQARQSYWLVVSCESYDHDRGMIQAFRLNVEKSEWIPFLEPLEGRHQGDRFGSASAFAESPALYSRDRVFRIAVAAPFYNEKRGLVQVHTAYESGWSQLGSDLSGDMPGENFGTSIGLSTTELPFLVVGAPQKRTDGESKPHGMVKLFHWRSLSSSDHYTWQLVGNPLWGLFEDDQLGASVAITIDGSRIAAASSNPGRGRGYIGVYDRVSYHSMVPVNDLILGEEEHDLWGLSLAINRYGSIVVSGSSLSQEVGIGDSVGSVRAFLDTSPFCTTPGSQSAREAESARRNIQTFIARLPCRDIADLVVTEEACSEINVYQDGEFLPCSWVATLRPVSDALFEEQMNLSSGKLPPDVTFHSSNVPTSPPSGFGSQSTPSLQSPSVISNYSEKPDSGTSDIGSRDGNPYIHPNHVRACHCDGEQTCLTQPFEEATNLIICVFAESTKVELIAVEEFRLEQQSLYMVIVNRGIHRTSGATSRCSVDTCVISTPVMSAVFGDNRPSHLVAKGNVTVMPKTHHDLRDRLLRRLQTTVGFESIIPLKRRINKGDSIDASASGNEKSEAQLKGVHPWLLWSVLSLLTLVTIFLYYQNRRKISASDIPV